MPPEPYANLRYSWHKQLVGPATLGWLYFGFEFQHIYQFAYRTQPSSLDADKRLVTPEFRYIFKGLDFDFHVLDIAFKLT